MRNVLKEMKKGKINMKNKINYKNIDDGRETVIPWEVMGFINLLYTLGIVPKVSINADL